MRRHLLTLIVCAGLPVASAAADVPPGFWHADYEDAAEAAEQSGRPLLIHFHADWCGPCRRMEADVLNQPALLGLEDRVAAVRVNYDRRADLVSRYNIKSLPCDLLVAHDGTELLRSTGFVGETTYVEQIERLAPAAPTARTAPMALLAGTMSHVGRAQHLGAVQGVGTELAITAR